MLNAYYTIYQRFIKFWKVMQRRKNEQKTAWGARGRMFESFRPDFENQAVTLNFR